MGSGERTRTSGAQPKPGVRVPPERNQPFWSIVSKVTERPKHPAWPWFALRSACTLAHMRLALLAAALIALAPTLAYPCDRGPSPRTPAEAVARGATVVFEARGEKAPEQVGAEGPRGIWTFQGVLPCLDNAGAEAALGNLAAMCSGSIPTSARSAPAWTPSARR